MIDKLKIPSGWCWDWGGMEREAIDHVQSALKKTLEEEVDKQQDKLTKAMERMVFEILHSVVKNIELRAVPKGICIVSLNDEWGLDPWEIACGEPIIPFNTLFSDYNEGDELDEIEKNLMAALEASRAKIKK